jgi:prepilin-type N-terminal cleavage/methylation domain-containing protein
MKTTFKNKNSGLTLVELLVVIAIMGLLTALIVPQVRLVNQDRNIREAARVVGTSLTQARDRAIGNSAPAGLLIERNTNLVFQNDVYYGGTRLYLMRNVPNYVDDHGEGAEVGTAPGSGYVVKIRKPWEQDEQNVVRVGDEIRLNNSSVLYRITSVTPGVNMLLQEALTLGINTTSPLPVPVQGNGIPYVIERSPRKMESSRVDLPDGYIVDLRYSGPLDLRNANGDLINGGEDGQLKSATKFSIAGDTSDLILTFQPDGSLKNMGFNGRSALPSGSVYLYVTEYRPQDFNPNDNENGAAAKVLANPASLWVTLSDQTGGVNVGYNAPNVTGDVYNDISGARQLSRSRNSANQ